MNNFSILKSSTFYKMPFLLNIRD